jgi:hypothetical protein
VWIVFQQGFVKVSSLDVQLNLGFFLAGDRPSSGVIRHTYSKGIVFTLVCPTQSEPILMLLSGYSLSLHSGVKIGVNLLPKQPLTAHFFAVY